MTDNPIRLLLGEYSQRLTPDGFWHPIHVIGATFAPSANFLDRAITKAIQENEMTGQDSADELTNRSLDGRGDERGRCPATLHVNGEHARCAGDRGHTDKHHSERLAAIWSRDETPREISYNLVGDKASEAEWEEFKAWKAEKERVSRFQATKAELRAVARAADERGDMDNTAGVGVAIWKAMKLHEAGTIDLSIYDEGKSA